MNKRLICALDTDRLGTIRDLSAQLGPHVGLLKVGLQAFVSHGPAAVEAASAHAPVFLDLKLHDIPNTVAGAAAAAADAGVAMLTVHASGGPRMVEAAVASAPGVTVLAVTVLTSLDDDTLALVGQQEVAAQVPRLARLATEAGASGLVCAPPEVGAVRAVVGAEPVLVVPGVRAQGDNPDDQARTGTPAAAVAAGADYVVVGRPITKAASPATAAAMLNEQLS